MTSVCCETNLMPATSVSSSTCPHALSSEDVQSYDDIERRLQEFRTYGRHLKCLKSGDNEKGLIFRNNEFEYSSSSTKQDSNIAMDVSAKESTKLHQDNGAVLNKKPLSHLHRQFSMGSNIHQSHRKASPSNNKDNRSQDNSDLLLTRKNGNNAGILEFFWVSRKLENFYLTEANHENNVKAAQYRRNNQSLLHLNPDYLEAWYRESLKKSSMSTTLVSIFWCDVAKRLTLSVISCPNNSAHKSVPKMPFKNPGYGPYLPELGCFIRTLAVRVNLSHLTVVTSLIYLDRLKSQLAPNAQGEIGTQHRLFIAASLLASKFVHDVSSLNARMVVKACNGLYSLAEIGSMEFDFLRLIRYDLKVTGADIDAYLQRYDSLYKVVMNY